MSKKVKVFIALLYFLYTPSATAQYNYYYGNMHAHTRYSDGNKDSATTGIATPGASYFYAKGTYHFDFLGIAEHNHYSSAYNPGMLLYKYALGIAQADTVTQTGNFVGFYGMEWGTISQGGHVVTHGYNNLIGWETINGNANYNVYCAKGDYTNYWNIVKGQTQSFTTLAHPEIGDYGDLLGSAAYNAGADSAIVGVAVRSGNATSTTTNYSDGPATSYEIRYRQALAKGYHVGPTIDHDTHYTNFGRANPSRTVVLATQLSRDSLSDAFRKNRFYASDDWNVQVAFTVNGIIMGGVSEGTSNPLISVSISDADAGDNVSAIQIYYGKPGNGVLSTLLTSASNLSSWSYTHSMAVDSQYYYYAKITQSDGDIIWTSPVWYKKVAVPLSLENIRLSAIASEQQVHLYWQPNTSLSNQMVAIEHGTNGVNFLPIDSFNLEQGLQPYHHTNAQAGIHYYRLRYLSQEGQAMYSNIAKVSLTATLVPYTLSPNPASDKIILSFNSFQSYHAELNIYNASGFRLMSDKMSVQGTYNSIEADISRLPSGNYYLVLTAEQGRVIDAKFTKQ